MMPRCIPDFDHAGHRWWLLDECALAVEKPIADNET
jgi:hypothetical protein